MHFTNVSLGEKLVKSLLKIISAVKNNVRQKLVLSIYVKYWNINVLLKKKENNNK